MNTVSVVMPLYNAEQYVEETLRSLCKQTYSDFEIIIVDDGSTDNSASVVEAFPDKRIKLYRNDSNRGIAYTRNRALELCNGKYIAIMDDDDLAPANRLMKTFEFLENNPDIDVVGGHCRFIDEKGTVIRNKQWNVFQNPQYIKAYLLLNNAIPNGSAMMRNDFLKREMIRYKDDMHGAEDYMFWVECSLHGTIANLDEIMLYWRIGHNNETFKSMNQRSNERKETIASIRKFALEKSNFVLHAEDYVILNKAFDEESQLEAEVEIEKLYCVLKKIVAQAENNKLSNVTEIKAMCRKRFGEVVGKAFFLWE